MRTRQVVYCLLLLVQCGAIWAQSQSERRHAGVQAAAPVLISYDRVVPLLDAIYEDVAAIQLSQISISSGNPNSAILDAVQQSFQGAFAANTMDALQNAANAKLFKSNVEYQSSLLSQLETATKTLTDATTAMSNAAKAKAEADANPSTSPGDQKQADDNFANAQAAQTAAQAQVTALKTAIQTPPSPLTSPGLTAAGGGSQGSSTKFLGTQPVNLQIPSFAAPSAGNGNPTLPPTQQMDTQIGLLWDRVMRLMSTIAEPDSEKDVHYELLRFYPSVTYADKKTNVIRLEYQATCSQSGVPKILDLYPRQAPVNIAGEKVKDKSFSLAALLGFGAVNASAAYNREHLKMIMAMSQASYMTGFGSGSNIFGWMLGKVMGDDTIAAGQREMYALIAVPNKDCGNLKVGPRTVEWLRADGQVFDTVNLGPTVSSLAYKYDQDKPKNAINSIEYAQAPSGSPVSILIQMKQPVDAEARVIVNGTVIPRARDNFARGTLITSAGSGPDNVGIFEQQPGTGGMPVGTWARVSGNEMVLVLDSRLYPDQFPSISVLSPQFGAAVLDTKTIPPGAKQDPPGAKQDPPSEALSVTLNGATYQCQPNCTTLPGLAQSSAVLQSGVASAFRMDDKRPNDYVVISIPSDVSVPPAARTAQIISSGDPLLQPWGPSPRVLATDNAGIASLGSCKSHGLVLLCKVWSEYQGLEATLDVYDTMHSGGALHARMKLDAWTPEDGTPQLLGTPSPVPHVNPGDGREADRVRWIFNFPIVAHPGDTAQMRDAGGNLILNNGAPGNTWAGVAPTINCPHGRDPVCDLKFEVTEQYLDRLTDYAEMVFYPENNPTKPYLVTERPAHLYNLRSALLPRLTAVDPDHRHLHGANLFFDGDQIQVGVDGPPVQLECPGTDGSECLLASELRGNAEDYVYLRQANGPNSPARYPLAIAGTAGSSLWTYTPLSPAAKAGAAKPTEGNKGKVANKPASGTAVQPLALPSESKIYIYQAKPVQ